MQIYDIPFDQNHMETTHHGNLSFPLAIYTTQISKNILGYIDWHWHHELQFCVVIHGEVEFYINQNHFILKEGEGIFINTEQLHMAKNYNKADSTYICLDLDACLISGFMGSIIQIKYVDPYLKNSKMTYCLLQREVSWQAKILDLLLSINQLYHESHRDEMKISIELATIWHLLVSSYNETNNPSKATISLQVRQILAYIRKNYASQITLEQIAQQVGLARSTCCREFKKQMGCTLFEYILNVRLQEASRLLLTSNLSITEIALCCGFNNGSYFTKEFKKKTGFSPSVYRQKNIEIKNTILSTI